MNLERTLFVLFSALLLVAFSSSPLTSSLVSSYAVPTSDVYGTSVEEDQFLVENEVIPNSNNDKLLQFKPELLIFNNSPVCIPSTTEFEIVNHGDEKIEVFSIDSSNLQFHPVIFQPQSIPSHGSINVKVYFLPNYLEISLGEFHILTSKGNFIYGVEGYSIPNPYNLSPLVSNKGSIGIPWSDKPIAVYNPYSVPMKIIDVFTTEDFIHLHKPTPSSSPPSTPPIVDSVATCLSDNICNHQIEDTTNLPSITDGNLTIIPPFTTQEVIYYSFNTFTLLAGYYKGYIHIKTEFDVNIIPIEVQLIQEGIQFLTQTLSFGMLIPQKENVTKELVIKMINYDVMPVEITSIQFLPNGLSSFDKKTSLKTPPETPQSQAQLTFVREEERKRRKGRSRGRGGSRVEEGYGSSSNNNNVKSSIILPPNSNGMNTCPLPKRNRKNSKLTPEERELTSTTIGFARFQAHFPGHYSGIVVVHTNHTLKQYQTLTIPYSAVVIQGKIQYNQEDMHYYLPHFTTSTTYLINNPSNTATIPSVTTGNTGIMPTHLMQLHPSEEIHYITFTNGYNIPLSVLSIELVNCQEYFTINTSPITSETIEQSDNQANERSIIHSIAYPNESWPNIMLTLTTNGVKKLLASVAMRKEKDYNDRLASHHLPPNELPFPKTCWMELHTNLTSQRVPVYIMDGRYEVELFDGVSNAIYDLFCDLFLTVLWCFDSHY